MTWWQEILQRFLHHDDASVWNNTKVSVPLQCICKETSTAGVCPWSLWRKREVQGTLLKLGKKHVGTVPASRAAFCSVIVEGSRRGAGSEQCCEVGNTKKNKKTQQMGTSVNKCNSTTDRNILSAGAYIMVTIWGTAPLCADESRHK